MQQPEQRGFRFSTMDGLVLAASTVGTTWLRSSGFPLWWLVPMVVVHFFLFCNVFRVWRRWELVWAGSFLLNTGIHLAVGEFGWLHPLLWQLPISLLVIILQIRSPHYCGIAAGILNPGGTEISLRKNSPL